MEAVNEGPEVDPSSQQFLKSFPNGITTSSLNKRTKLIEELRSRFIDSKIPAKMEGPIIKFMVRGLLGTLHRYKDQRSRILIENELVLIVKSYPTTGLTTILEAMHVVSIKGIHDDKGAFNLISWLNAVVTQLPKEKDSLTTDEEEIVLKIHVNLVSFLGRSGSDRKILSMFRREGNKLGIQKYMEVLKKDLFDNINGLLVWATVLPPNKTFHSQHRGHILSLFCKHLIGSKNAVSKDHLDQLSPLFTLINKEEFEETLLPAISRASLRSPEISFHHLPSVLSSLKIDLSKFAPELGKLIGTSLHSKEDALREQAVETTKALAIQCSDSSAIENLITHLFAILNGSEGKLTIINQRMSVVSGIGSLSYHSVHGTEQVHQLSLMAIEQFMVAMKGELIEASLCHLVVNMGFWCKRLKSLPQSLLDWFKASSANKVTAPTRAAYIQCLEFGLKEPSARNQVEGDVVSVLGPICLRSISSPISQIPVIVEGLKATLFILRAVHYEPKLELKAKGCIPALCELSRASFLMDKFIMTTSVDSLMTLLAVIERLYIDHSTKLKEQELNLIRPLILLMSHREHSLRARAVSVAQTICANSRTFQVDLLKGSTKVLLDLEVLGVEEAKSESHETSEDVSTGPVFKGCFIHRSLRQVAVHKVQEANQVILSSLIPAHTPVVYNTNHDVWMSIVQVIIPKPVDILPMIEGHKNKIIEMTLGVEEASIRKNIIKSLVGLFPSSFISLLFKDAVSVMNIPDFKMITKSEFEIFQTPEGALYNMALLDQYKDVETKNIKRENKAYSYKEQMAEMALRKELDEKTGKDKKPTLNKKQQEVMATELEKEAVVRARMAKLQATFQHMVDNLHAIVEGNPFEMSKSLGFLLNPLMNLFTSPLCNRQSVELFVLLGKTAFKWEKYPALYAIIAYTTLRQMKIPSTGSTKWSDVMLKESIQKVLQSLGCNLRNGDDSDSSGFNDSSSKIEPSLTGAGFTFTYPLLSRVILDETTSDETIKLCLEIIAAHARMRQVDCPIDVVDEQVAERFELHHPMFLPRYDIFNSLIGYMKQESFPLHMESEVVSVLLEVAQCTSGEEDTATPSKEEIDCLLLSLKEEKLSIRAVAIKCLEFMKDTLVNPDWKYDVNHRIFVTFYDPDQEVNSIARRLWSDSSLDFSFGVYLIDSCLGDVKGAKKPLRVSLARGLDHLLMLYPMEGERIFRRLIAIYKENNILPVLELDAFGRPKNESIVDYFGPRAGVAVILAQINHQAPTSILDELTKFFVPDAFTDRNETVQNLMLDAAIKFVDAHGSVNTDSLITALQSFLENAKDSQENDAVRKNVIILLGTLAKHLDKDDPRVKPIVIKLIESLSTPSQIVQEAVANCLPYLVPSFRDDAPRMVEKLLELLLTSDKVGERIGAAYGIAAVVKGRGISSLREFGIMEKLTDAVQDKKKPLAREGALFAFEKLCLMLDKLVEPFIIKVLPDLLLCFGDNIPKIRNAAIKTSKAFMTKLTAYGVKLILPSLLKALDDDSWRTKVGSIELLGAMSHCAPKQLSSCLPTIVPKLMDVLSDSHEGVQKAASGALKQIGSVIRNPEVQAIVPILISALQDPGNKTNLCLDTMLNTKFVHFIDAPSLALIMPVIERAFKSRSTETRKMAAQIIGNMYTLTDQKDLAPYLPSVIPGLKASLLDPVPEVRAVTARALGAMVKGMGEEICAELMPWLKQTLVSEISSVDRSGAAQGLAEVVGSLGRDKLDGFMDEIIRTTERDDISPSVRDGYIMLYIYLPIVFQQDFVPYIGRIIDPVLKSLADENEFVRETALRAGQRIVNMYSDSAIQLLLPQLENGLFGENWRVRLSSILLLGDVLYKISGVSGKMTTETVNEDDNFGTEQSYLKIIKILGMERRNRVFSGLYMGRSDVALPVRQAALHVWKVVVTNTPRTLKEILPTMFSLLLGCLASNSEEKQQVAARTLGDLVRKLGERVLPEIIPILEKGLKSDRADQRQGVCIGLSEIIASTSRDTVQAFSESLVPTVTKALYDPLPEVRMAAAKTFESLHSAVGSSILDEILPKLLDRIEDPLHGENTLDGLRQIMAIKGKVVLPYLVPQLTATPANTRALAILSSVSGDSLSRHLVKVLPAILKSLSDSLDTDQEKVEFEYCQTIILSVTDDVGVRTIVDYMLDASKSEQLIVRRGAVSLLHAYCEQNRSLGVYVPQLLRGLVFLFSGSEPEVSIEAWEAVNCIIKNLDPKVLINLVSDARSAVRYAASDLRNNQSPKKNKPVLLPGFCLARGIGPILPIFREAILNGNPEQKETAAMGLYEVIDLTSPEALKPSVVNIAGPLIRILGDRYVWNVKVAVLDTLSLLLEKVGSLLRPFLPQLQQTFLKALADSHKQVRLRAANALSQLVNVHTRCDPLFKEMITLVNSDDETIRETALYAIRVAVLPGGDNMTEPIRKNIIQVCSSHLGHHDDSTRVHAASAIGCLSKHMSKEDFASVKNILFNDDMSMDWVRIHGCSLALRIALKEATDRLVTESYDLVCKTLMSHLSSDRIPIVFSGIKGTSYLFLYQVSAGIEVDRNLLNSFSRTMNHSNNEVKQTTAASSIFLSKSYGEALPLPMMKSLIPMLVNGTKEKNPIVKSNSEQALISVLRLRIEENPDTFNSLIESMDAGPRESLQDCMSKVLKRIMAQNEPKDEEFDDTLFV